MFEKILNINIVIFRKSIKTGYISEKRLILLRILKDIHLILKIYIF